MSEQRRGPGGSVLPPGTEVEARSSSQPRIVHWRGVVLSHNPAKATYLIRTAGGRVVEWPRFCTFAVMQEVQPMTPGIEERRC